MSPLPARLPPIEGDFLIIGEGKGDAAFFRHLCEERGIADFQIEEAGGTGKLEEYLKGLSSRTNFEQLKAILLVGDNDDKPADSFNRMRVYLKRAGLPVPNEPLKVARNHPHVLALVVMMVPYTVAGGPTRGSLETLLLPAIDQHKPQVKACVDAYFTCLAGNWTKNQEDKFRVRCSIAAMWPDDPNFGLQFALDPARDMIPLSHNRFDEIASFLLGFAAFCAPPAGGGQ